MRGVSEGVYQLSIPMRFNPLGCTYSYLLRDAATLIDTGVGTNDAYTAMEAQLKGVELRPKDVESIILTHLHRDHTGLVDRIRSVSGATVLAHRIAFDKQKQAAEEGERRYEYLREGLRLLGGSGYLNLLDRFERTLRRPRPVVEVDEPFGDDEKVALEGSTLRVFWTPGHSPEHVCLYDEDRSLLYSGDHVLPKITSHISIYTHQEGNPLGDYLRSLKRLRGLPVDLVLPAHEHAFHDLDGRISELFRHHEMRCEEVKDALKEREKTVFQVSADVSWDSRPWPEMRFWTRRMAALETLAHLVYLRNKGEVKEELREGVLYYTLR